jgi:hypothetical protein
MAELLGNHRAPGRVRQSRLDSDDVLIGPVQPFDESALLELTSLAEIPQSCSSNFPTLGLVFEASRFLLLVAVSVLGFGVCGAGSCHRRC